MSHDPADKLLSISELAKALKVCPLTVSRWTIKKAIPCYRFGKRFVRYDLNQVLQALSESKQTK